MKYHILQPDAGRVITSLRDAGYDFKTAIADIVDNSIAANAKLIKIAAICNAKDGAIRVAIADNGHGMDMDDLCNAMTYGSAKREDTHSLGKYGLGLKTASTSQCRKVTLVSRKKGSQDASKLCLDIDHAEQTGRWEYLEDSPTRMDLRYLESAANGSAGTVVIWENCDRLMGRTYKNPGGKSQQDAFQRKVDELRFHLGIVFQRFLDRTDRRARNIEIVLNGDKIHPFDPFAKRFESTLAIYDDELIIGWEGEPKDYPVHAAAYVVPSREDLENKSDEDSVFPPKISPDSMQGIYVYRENRLIHWGDWCGLYKTEFHQRLCRVELSFYADLDDCFSVDFQKSKVGIDPIVSDWLRTEVLPEARRIADARYRKGVTQVSTKKGAVTHSRANKQISDFETSDKERQFSIVPLENGRRRIQSRKGRQFIEVIPKSSGMQLKASIRPVESLPESALWRAGVYNDKGIPRTYVEINTSHPFYQHAYYTCKGNNNAIRCLDYLIWSLAQAEYATKDQESKENYSDMIIEVSRTLRMLAEDLPVDES